MPAPRSHPTTTAPSTGMSILNHRSSSTSSTNSTPLLPPPLAPQPPTHSYIPTPLALSYLENINRDLTKTTTTHAAAAHDLQTLHEATTQYYTNLLHSTKQSACSVIDTYKIKTIQTQNDFKSYQTSSSAEIAALKTDLLNKQQELSSLSSFLSTTTTKYVGEKFQHVTEHHHDESSIAALHETIEQLQSKLADTESSLADTESSLAQTSSSLAQTTASLSTVTDKLTDSTMTLASKQLFLASLGIKLSSKDKSLAAQTLEVEELTANLTSKTQTLTEREQTLAATTSQLDVSNAQSQELTAKLTDSTTTLASKQLLLTSLGIKLSSKDKSLAAQTMEVSTLAANLTATTSQATSLAAELSSTSSALTVTQQLQKELASELTTTTSQLTESSAALAALNDTLSSNALAAEAAESHFTASITSLNDDLLSLSNDHSLTLTETAEHKQNTLLQISILETQLSAHASTSSELSDKLTAAELLLKTEQSKSSSSSAALLASSQLAVLHLATLEKSEQSIFTTQQQLLSAQVHISELSAQVSSSPPPAVLRALELDLAAARSFADETSLALELAQKDQTSQQRKFEKQIADSQTLADSLKQTADKLQAALNSTTDVSQQQLDELADARAAATASANSSAALQTQLDSLHQDADSLLALRDESNANVTKLTSYIESLESTNESGIAQANSMLSAERATMSVLSAQLESVTAKTASDEVIVSTLKRELLEQDKAKERLLNEQSAQQQQQLDEMRESASLSLAHQQQQQQLLAQQADELDQKLKRTLLDLSETQLESEAGKREFQEQVRELLRDLAAKKQRADEISEELSAFSSKTSKSLKELQIKCEKLQHDCQEQSILRNKAERRLKEVEWLRLEEVKKNSARKKKAPAAAAPRKKKAGAKSESESMVLMILKQENEQLKRDLSKAQKVGGKKEKEKERDKEKGKEKVMPPPSSAPPEAETAAAPALAHKQAKEALKAADRDKKRVKEEIKTWLSDFEAENGRPADSSDKEQIMDKYKELKALDKRVKELKDEVEELKELKDKVSQDDSIPTEIAIVAKAVDNSSSLATIKNLSNDIQSLRSENTTLKEKLAEQLTQNAAALATAKKTAAEAAAGSAAELAAAEAKVSKLNEKVTDLKTNGDAILKNDAEMAEKRAGEFRDEMLAAKQESKTTSIHLRELKEQLTRAELELKGLRDEQPKSSSDEVNALRKKVITLEREVVVKSKASVAGWEKLAEADAELDKKVDEALQEGIKEGEKKADMKLMLQATQMNTLKSSLEGAQEKIERKEEKVAQLKEQLGEVRRNLAGKDEEIEEVKKRAGEEAAEVAASVAAHTPREEEGKEAGGGKETGKEKELPAVANHDPAITGNNVGTVISAMEKAIVQGTMLWKKGKKKEGFDLYKKTCQKGVDGLPRSLPQVMRLNTSLQASKKQLPAAGAVTLRKAIDAFVNEQMVALATPGEEVEKAWGTPAKGKGEAAAAGGKADPALQKKVQQLEKQLHGNKATIEKLNEKLAKAKEDAAGAASSAKEKDSSKKMQEILDKKHKKVMDEANKKHDTEVATISKKLSKATEEGGRLKTELEEALKATADLRAKYSNVSKMEKELEAAQAVAAEVGGLQEQKKADDEKIVKLEADYSEEKGLRKKYWNMMEDMKGKIRVYARCRPFNKLEKEQDSKQCVKFVDDMTLSVESSRGEKDFTYDGVFSPSQSQAEVYEDTSHLINSAIDGYNVCLFAYGQTGSGKTWTMTGDVNSEENQGITPRAMKQLYGEIEELSKKGTSTITVSTYFVELYNDQLVDLFYILDHKKKGGNANEKPPKLEIKLNAQKKVHIKNAVVKQAANYDVLTKLFNSGNKMRHVGGTRMNAESSRSHSIFAIMIDNVDNNTGQSSSGKLTLVDLAGSERADKTGASGDRLKEGIAINTSLSALGDVISALCRGEKIIPYRNNKLTQVMQDSLGGNAKTLMFVNISPADYNASETVTSLDYASRVKEIKNTGTKDQEGAEVHRLKDIIKRLKAGEDVEDDEILKAE